MPSSSKSHRRSRRTTREGRRRPPKPFGFEGLEARTLLSTVSGEFIVYTLGGGDIYRIAAQSGAQPQNLSVALNALSRGTTDANVNISPNGQWLAIDTDRFGIGAAGSGPGLAVVSADLTQGAAVVSGGDFVYPEGITAISSSGNLVVYCAGGGPHIRDLWALTRAAGGPWGAPQLLSGGSPYRYNTEPALSADGATVLFDGGQQSDKTGSEAICEEGTNGQGFRTVVTKASAPAFTDFNGRVNGAHFAADGSILFEVGSDQTGDQVWRLPKGATTPLQVAPGANDEVSPVGLPDGRIVSLWLDRAGNPSGAHELTLRDADGNYLFTLLPGVDVADIGIGAGGIAATTQVSTLQVSPASLAVSEGDGSATITVTRTGNLASAVSVKYATVAGTAQPGVNYTAESGTLNFAANQADATIKVPLIDDHKPGPTTTFQILLSGPGAGAALGAASVATVTITDATPTPGPQILLTPAILARLRQEAADTPQWQDFRDNLDRQLDKVFGPGSYQADQLTLIGDYALAYQVLKDNPATAALADDYADKAIGLMKSGMNDYQRATGAQALRFLARGNASTTTYTLPGAGIHPETVRVVVAPVSTATITRGAANGQDVVGVSETFLKVSNTPDGPANYVENKSWSHNPNLPNNEIDWSLPGAEPAAGSTYYVTVTSSSDTGAREVPRDAPGQPGGNFYTLKGNTITFAKPLATNQAVFVEYIYGVHAADGSSLAYQQTSAGDGGFNSIFVDTGYTSRYLGMYIGIGLDWLYDYPGLTPALKQQATSLLVRWSDFLRDNSYYNNSPTSNMEAGTYVSRVLTALALSNGRDPADDPRLIREVQDYRDNFVKPALTAPTASVKGGFWAEGWNYGPLSIQNILLAEQALETAGLAREAAGLAPGAEEHAWAAEVLQSLISGQPTPATIYDGGDGYNFPAPFPNRSLIGLLAAETSDPTLRSYANHIVQTYTFSQRENTPSLWIDLLYRNPSAPASFWSSYPLQYLAQGQGLVTARADWSYNSTFLSFQLGNPVQADHQTNSPGMLEIFRGGDDLLANAQASNEVTLPSVRSQYANIVVIDSHGDTDTDGNPVQTYPFTTGVWYGTPGAFLTSYDAAPGFVYAAGDYRAAYSSSSAPGGGGPATKLTRQVVYLRPDLVVVHDRAATLKADYLKQLRWNFLSAPTVSGNAFVEQVGSSKLFGATFSDSPLTTSVTPYNTRRDARGNVIDPVGYEPHPFYEVRTNNTTPALGVNYTTAFQSAPSTASRMVATVAVKSADGRMEGVEMGGALVLFGKDGTLPASVSTITVNLAGAPPTSELFVDLQPGKAYQVVVNGVSRTLTADSQGTISSATSATSPTISWAKPADIVYGTPLGAAQLDATASAPGTFAYSPASGTLLRAGQGQTLSVTFTPDGSTVPVTATTTIDVLKATPTVAWPKPGRIAYGTPLGASQLDATASVPGSFAYSPAPGSVLRAGRGQTLSVTFTPDDSADYSPVTTTTTLDVFKSQGDFNGDGASDVGTYVPGQDLFALDDLDPSKGGGASLGQNVFHYGYHTDVSSVPLVGDFNGDGATDIGTYVPGQDLFALDALNPSKGNGASLGQNVFHYGYHTGAVFSVPLVGDFNGDGTTDIGTYVPGQDLFALDYLNPAKGGGASLGQDIFHYGFHTGDAFSIPIVGDFNGDGTTDVGTYVPGQDLFALDYLNPAKGNGASLGQNAFHHGFHADGMFSLPLVGDFNGDGMTDVGTYVPSQDLFALDYLNALKGGGASLGQNVFHYGFHAGGISSVPLVGDFNGDGATDVGAYVPGQDLFALDYLNAAKGNGASLGQNVFHYGFHTPTSFSQPLRPPAGISPGVAARSLSALSVMPGPSPILPGVVATSIAGTSNAPSKPKAAVARSLPARSRTAVHDAALASIAAGRGGMSLVLTTSGRRARVASESRGPIGH